MAAEGIARIGPGGDLGWHSPDPGPVPPSDAGTALPGAAGRVAVLYDPVVPARLGPALERALRDPAVRAVVLDLAAAPDADPSLSPAEPADILAAEAGFAALAACIATAPKPVVALIAGPVAGPLAALALAAALRVAAPGGQIGFPEVGLCLAPGAGATQRAAWLAGAGPALAVLLSGRMLAAAEAQKAGLIEMVTEAAAPAAAAAAAALASARERGGPLPFTHDPRRGLADPAGFLAAVATARAGLAPGGLPAPAQIIDCIEAALLLPEEGGLGLERAVFETLAATPQSQALRYIAEAEARASAGGMPPPGPVALIAGGAAAEDLAARLLAGGTALRLLGPDVAALRERLEGIAELQEADLAAGRITEAARDAAWDRLSATTDPDTLAGCQIGIVALQGPPVASAKALAVLEEALPAGAVLASLGDVAEMAAALLQRPAGHVALQVLAAPNRRAVLQIGAGEGTDPAALEAGLGLARAIDMVPLPCRPGAGGFPGPRLRTALQRAGGDLLLLGSSPAAVDAALRDFGFGQGPFEAMDRAGLDSVAGDGRPGIAAHLAAAGRRGRRQGRGFLIWHKGAARGQDDPDVLALIAEERRAQGLPDPGPGMAAAEICQLCLAALANEGARMLSAGVVSQAPGLDLAAGAALGFPRHRGGPMHWAGASGGRTGLLAMRNALKAQAGALPEPMAGFWAPDPLWDRLIREGKRF